MSQRGGPHLYWEALPDCGLGAETDSTEGELIDYAKAASAVCRRLAPCLALGAGFLLH